MAEEDYFEVIVASLASAVAISNKLAQRNVGGGQQPILAIPITTAGSAWRELVDRLNDQDPEKGWGRMLWNGVEYVAYKGEFPGASWL